jgi:hypothetical protein
LWVAGPTSTRRFAMWFVENPERMTALGAAQMAIFIWLAPEQHRNVWACRECTVSPSNGDLVQST